MEEVDALIIGGGVIGLACAARLAREGRSVVVVERHARHGLETSSRNSEVVHAGFYYPTGSLKATLCVAGRRAIYALAETRGLYARRTGKVVVALAETEIPKLEALLERGRANGVEGLALIDRAELSRKAPGVRGVAALWSPETGIMDTEQIMGHLLESAESRGAIFVWGGALEAAERIGPGYGVRLSSGERIYARAVVNAAGLEADRVAALPGLDIDAAGYRLSWFKGEYFSLRRPLPIEPLVYPLPGPHGLGIHLTIDRQGRHRLGPNAFKADRPAEGPPKDLYAVDASKRREFFEAASAYLAGLEESWLEPGTAGIRPKLSADGSFRDFVIAEESARGLPRWVNLVGIESPGFTASPAIADSVADLLSWGAS